MAFNLAELLSDVDAAAPCGPDLRELDGVDTLREAAAQETPVEWQRHLERALAVASACRDLRAWVWLTRAQLAAEGWTGLASGLELIGEGLDRWWDVLPPQDTEETDPAERFMARFTALSALGMSCALFPPRELAQRRDVYHLGQELDLRLARNGPPDAATHSRIMAALTRIEGVFKAHLGNGFDSQVGFELLREKLGRAAPSPPASESLDGAAATPVPRAGGIGPAVARTREDVVRLLEAVLAYYAAHEPASPVPLLVTRAKRLVPMSFVEAMRELAPGGMKELATVAGLQDEAKAKKAGD